MLAINTAHRGGAEGQLIRLAVELRERGVDARVAFALAGGPLVKHLEDAGVPFRIATEEPPARRLLVSRTSPWLRAIVGARHIVGEWQPRLINSWLPHSTVVFGRLAAGAFNTPRIVSFRGGVNAADIRPAARIFRQEVRQADALTVNSIQLAAADVTEWGGRSALLEIPNGIELPTSTASPDVEPPVGVVVANFRAVKGHSVLVSALAKTRTRPRLRLVGSGALIDEVRHQAKVAGVLECLDFVGQTGNVQNVLLDCQFAVHPSLSEGMSNAVLEELAAGLPVITTDVGASAEVVRSGGGGLVVAPGDAMALAQRIDELVLDPQRRATLGAAARRSVERYSWDSCALAYIELFRSVCPVAVS